MTTEGYTPFFGKETLEQLRSNDPDAKNAIVDKLVSAYHNNFFSRQEQQLADSIFRVLVKNSDVGVRERLARVLKDNLLLPHDIVMALATDIADAVACPVLESSYLLSEDDLTSLISNTSISPRLEAIARREALSAKVSSALMVKKLPKVMAMLLGNSAAQLNEKEVVEAIEEMPPSQELMELAIKRKDFGEVCQQTLKKLAVKSGFTQFSQTLNEDLDPEELVEAARLYSLLGLTLEQVKSEGMEALVRKLAQDNRLSLSLLLRSLCIGELSLVEHAFSRLAGVPLSNTRILLRDRGGRGFEAIYKASKLSETYSAIFANLIKLLITDTTLKTLHPRLLQRHLLIAVQDDANEEAVEFVTAIIQRAAQDMELAEHHNPTAAPLADGEIPTY